MSTIRTRVILRTVLITVVFFFVVSGLAYAYVNRDRLFPLKNTIVLYGREGCSITKAVRYGLESKGINYMFADVNIPAVDDELRYKLGPRFKEPEITFPIVHVGGKLLLTPTPEQIEEALNEFAATASNGEVSRDYTMLVNGADPAPHY